MNEAVFTQALGLTAPWEVERVELDDARKRLDLHVIWRAKTGTCPGCGVIDQPIHDRRARTWRHLHFFQFETWIHCELARVRCTQCGSTTQVPVPWARPGSQFTLMFEAFALTLAREMPVAACARILGCAQQPLWRLIDAHVRAARAREDHAAVRTVGIDETACRRGHDYITLVHDLDDPRLLFATPGRDAKTIEAGAEDLRSHGGDPQAIETVCMDMSTGFISGVGRVMPRAAIAFDRFHVIQMANAALEEVRREEVRTEPILKRTRWMSWARRCRLEPMKKLAATIKRHWPGVLHAFGAAHLHNGYVEAVNSLVQAAKARARGYGTTQHFIAICHLIAGRLKHLPPSPFAPVRDHAR